MVLRFAYGAHFGAKTVSIYSIDASTGRLTSLGTVVTGISPSFVATTGAIQ
jgi:6-phosphogluconolactonase (cycloisomerase 2 family)